jgi:cyanophycinase-like exopeptidase
MSASMVEVHKYAMSLVEGPIRAAFLDTPAGFQLNADLLSQKAVKYFKQRLNTPLTIVSFKSAEQTTTAQMQAIISTLGEATYIFAGPGSPTYAIKNWKDTPIHDILFKVLFNGGCLTFASAAALTLGHLVIPVYEIYKVGEKPHWVEGLNVLGHNGLDVAVVPHWNNTSGGDHDTRFCFMGEPRWAVLESQLPQHTTVLGIDEHTACILRLDANQGEVRGVGQVTIRRNGQEHVFVEGASFSLDMLRLPHIPNNGQIKLDESRLPEGTPVLSWNVIRARHDTLLAAGHPPPEELATYVYDLIAFMSTARERADWQSMQWAEEALREAVVELVARLQAGAVNEEAIIAPYVDLLLEVRHTLREIKQWAEADRIRDRLRDLRVIVEDTPQGTVWRQPSD